MTPLQISHSRKWGNLFSAELTESKSTNWQYFTLQQSFCMKLRVGVYISHRKQPTKEVVAEKMNMADMAVTVVWKMLDKSRMVGPFIPSMIPWKCGFVIIELLCCSVHQTHSQHSWKPWSCTLSLWPSSNIPHHIAYVFDLACFQCHHPFRRLLSQSQEVHSPPLMPGMNWFWFSLSTSLMQPDSFWIWGVGWLLIDFADNTSSSCFNTSPLAPCWI